MTPRKQQGRRKPRAATQAQSSAKPRSAQQLVQIETPVQIEKPIYGGAFLARIDGKAVFVPLALPGEEARVCLVEDKGGYAVAEAEQIITRAAERVEPDCPHFGRCGGCQYQHANYEAQLSFKQAILRETLQRAGVNSAVEIEVLAGTPWAYRNRIRLALDSHGNPGYRGRRSHHVVAIEQQCPIAAPLLVETATAIAQLLGTLAPGFRPSEISLFCNHDETALLVSIFADQSAKFPLDGFASALKGQISALAGLEIVREGRGGQAARTIAQWGQSSIAYRAAGFDYRVDHGAFFQVNRRLVDALVERVTAGRRGSLAWDLFAGVGLFARQLAAKFKRVMAVESAPTATAALAHNLGGTNAEPVSSSTLDFLRRSRKAERPDLIVVDPPRTGLGAETTSLLADVAAPAVTYVSCDPATLARDLRALTEAGYSIRRLTLADLFPQTFHIETIVDLIRG